MNRDITYSDYPPRVSPVFTIAIDLINQLSRYKTGFKCEIPTKIQQTLRLMKSLLGFIAVAGLFLLASSQIVRQATLLDGVEYAPVDDRALVEQAEQAKIGPALDVLLNFNLKTCSTCESLKYFAIKAGNNNVTTLRYLTVGASCVGALSFNPPTGPSGRPGNDQLFVATQIQDETWVLQPRNCPGNYIKATSSSTLAVQNGLSSNARFWIEYHDNHVHLQSATYSTSYWGGVTPVVIGPGASSYMVEFWPSRAWP